MRAMGKLKSNLSCGPDNLPPLLFTRLALPLALVFSQLLSVAAVPDMWKRAVIVPVFKKGIAGDVTNQLPPDFPHMCPMQNYGKGHFKSDFWFSYAEQCTSPRS